MKCYAFLDFIDIGDANACMMLDGLMVRGFALKIRRPNDYVVPVGLAAAPVPGARAAAGHSARRTRGLRSPPYHLTRRAGPLPFRRPACGAG